jgi:hypothetical protein
MANCVKLENFDIKIKKIGTIKNNFMVNCSSLRYIDLYNLLISEYAILLVRASNVNIGNNFMAGCTNLDDINFNSKFPMNGTVGSNFFHANKMKIEKNPQYRNLQESFLPSTKFGENSKEIFR